MESYKLYFERYISEENEVTRAQNHPTGKKDYVTLSKLTSHNFNLLYNAGK